jgi:putative DNA primase/helicase
MTIPLDIDGATEISTDPESESAPGTLKAVNLQEFLALELPPPTYLLKPIISVQGLTLVYAKRGEGKTFFGLNVAYAVATGGTFLRWQAPNRKKVLYIDGEMSASEMQQRLASIVEGSPIEADPKNLQIIAYGLQESPMPDLSTAEGQAELEPHLIGVDLVIVDNLSCLMRSGKSNEEESWRPVQQWALDLRRRNISVLFVHHAGKGGDQRGSSAREDVLDVVIRLSRPEGYKASEGARFVVELTKARGIAGEEAASFEAQLIIREGAAEWTTKAIEDDDSKVVEAMIAEGCSLREIEKKTGISKSTAHRKKMKAETVARSRHVSPVAEPVLGLDSSSDAE